MICPNCGADLELTVQQRNARPWDAPQHTHTRAQSGGLGRVPTSSGRMQAARPYALGAVAGAAEQWDEVRFDKPARGASRESDVSVPALQALISGVFAGLAALVVGVGAVITWALPWWLAPLVGVACGLAVTWSRWEGLLSDSRDLLRDSETYVKRGDYITPEQPQAAGVLRVDVRPVDAGGNYTGGAIQYDALPIDAGELRAVLTAHVGGRCNLSRRGVASLPGIGTDKARAILDALLTSNYISYPNGPTHPDGAQLTSKGKAMARTLKNA